MKFVMNRVYRQHSIYRLCATARSPVITRRVAPRQSSARKDGVSSHIYLSNTKLSMTRQICLIADRQICLSFKLLNINYKKIYISRFITPIPNADEDANLRWVYSGSRLTLRALIWLSHGKHICIGKAVLKKRFSDNRCRNTSPTQLRKII